MHLLFLQDFYAENEEIIREFIDNFRVVPLHEEIAEIAISIRRDNKIKLPDAIIWASAKFNDSLLITRNIKDFPKHSPDIKIPYSI
jgi:predicted nucleic acid-binding protein